MLLIALPTCTTCQGVEKILKDKHLPYTYQNIKEDPPTAEELKTYKEKSGLPLKRFFNTSGQVYREMNLKDKLPEMSEEKQYQLLSSNGMLIKRPILVEGDEVHVGGKDVRQYLEDK